MDIREVDINLGLMGHPLRRVRFVRASGEQRWRSDAVVAICRGSGRTVYPAAISLSDAEMSAGMIWFDPYIHLAPFRDLRPRIIGWVERPELGIRGTVVATADRANWDPDSVSTATALAPTAAVAHTHVDVAATFVAGCPRCEAFRSGSSGPRPVTHDAAGRPFSPPHLPCQRWASGPCYCGKTAYPLDTRADAPIVLT